MTREEITRNGPCVSDRRTKVLHRYIQYGLKASSSVAAEVPMIDTVKMIATVTCATVSERR